MSFGFKGTDRSREDSPELNPPPGIEDNRQCALCLTYGDDSANVGILYGVLLSSLAHDELFVVSKPDDQVSFIQWHLVFYSWFSWFKDELPSTNLLMSSDFYRQFLKKKKRFYESQ